VKDSQEESMATHSLLRKQRVFEKQAIMNPGGPSAPEARTLTVVSERLSRIKNNHGLENGI